MSDFIDRDLTLNMLEKQKLSGPFNSAFNDGIKQSQLVVRCLPGIPIVSGAENMYRECDVFDLRGAVQQEIKSAVKDMCENESVKRFACVGISIVFKNGDMITYKEEEYTDYKYDGKVFVVIREEQWIGIFNIDAIEYVTVGK